MTEQQQHLKQLLEQRTQLENQINLNKELFLKIQGVIEYLFQIGVTLPPTEENDTEELSQEEQV